MPAHGTIAASAERDVALRRVAHVALDMDGTIYSGNTLFACTKPFLALLTELNIGYTFLTNNPSKSVADYLKHLARLGLSAAPHQLHTSSQAVIHHLQEKLPHLKRLFILGTPSMVAEFERAGFTSTLDDPGDSPDGVVVGFDTTLTYSRLGRTAWWLKQGKPFFATNPDRVCPTDQPTVLPDCASICAALEQAVGRKPDLVFGKPDPSMLQRILQQNRLQPDQIAMVGDRLYTDVLMAQRAGAFSVLVLTGEATRNDVAQTSAPPDLVVPSLAEFGELLRGTRD